MMTPTTEDPRRRSAAGGPERRRPTRTTRAHRAALTALAVGLVAATPSWSRGPAAEDDHDLARAVRARLRQAPELDRASIDVAVDDGVALLEGEVDTLADRWFAERRAGKVYGVIDVRSALLLRTAGRADTAVEKGVRGALADRLLLTDSGLEVEVRDGRCRLWGTVRDGRVRLLARDAVAAVPGVVGVDDEVETAEVDDETLQQQLDGVFGRRGRLRLAGRIVPSVAAGVVTLTGEVPRPYERWLAENLALGVRGVRQVIDQLEVVPPPTEVPLIRID